MIIFHIDHILYNYSITSFRNFFLFPQALVNVGAILGGPIGGWLIESLGRKVGIMFCGIPFEIGWLLITYARNHFMLYFGRMICGIAVGMVSLMVPVSMVTIR